MRPIEEKLKYQINKLLSSASSETIGMSFGKRKERNYNLHVFIPYENERKL